MLQLQILLSQGTSAISTDIKQATTLGYPIRPKVSSTHCSNPMVTVFPVTLVKSRAEEKTVV